jgi:hypothetical protein
VQPAGEQPWPRFLPEAVKSPALLPGLPLVSLPGQQLAGGEEDMWGRRVKRGEEESEKGKVWKEGKERRRGGKGVQRRRRERNKEKGWQIEGWEVKDKEGKRKWT